MENHDEDEQWHLQNYKIVIFLEFLEYVMILDKIRGCAWSHNSNSVCKLDLCLLIHKRKSFWNSNDLNNEIDVWMFTIDETWY